MGRVKRSGVGGRKREEKIFFSPSPPLFPSFALAPSPRVTIFTQRWRLQHKQLSPAQNTPALQANNNGSLSYISYHYSSRLHLSSLPPVKLAQTACLGVKIHPRFILLMLDCSCEQFVKKLSRGTSCICTKDSHIKIQQSCNLELTNESAHST